MEEKKSVLYLCQENDADGLNEALDVGKCDLEGERDARGRTGLHLAAARGGAEAVRVLLQAGLDTNLTDYHGNTPLHLSGHKDVIQLLIEYGAHVDARNKHGDTPLTMMRRRGVGQEAVGMMEMGITEMENLHEGRRARHPSSPQRPSLAGIKNIWYDFCADIGVWRLAAVLVFVLCLSLYVAYTITGFSRPLVTRVPIDLESRHVEL